MTSTITASKVKQVCKLIDKGLNSGLGDGGPGQMCIEQVISAVFDDDPYNDRPKCVHPILRSFKINLNDDAAWKNNKERARGLKRLGVAQLGTKKRFSQKKFVTLLHGLAVKYFVAALPKMMKKSDDLEILFHKMQEINNDLLTTGYDLCVNDVNSLAFWLNQHVRNNKFMYQYCEDVVQVLVKMKTPGSKYLKYAKR